MFGLSTLKLYRFSNQTALKLNDRVLRSGLLGRLLSKRVRFFDIFDWWTLFSCKCPTLRIWLDSRSSSGLGSGASNLVGASMYNNMPSVISCPILGFLLSTACTGTVFGNSVQRRGFRNHQQTVVKLKLISFHSLMNFKFSFKTIKDVAYSFVIRPWTVRVRADEQLTSIRDTTAMYTVDTHSIMHCVYSGR